MSATPGTTPYNFCDATDDNLELKLPDIVQMRGNGLTYVRADASGNTVTISTDEVGTDIGGASSYVLSGQWASVRFIAPLTGTTWIVEASNSTDASTHAGLTAAHGATGAVVGTTNTQTLSNKTLSNPRISGSYRDSSGNIIRSPQPSPTTPVNYLTEVNSEAGNPPAVGSAGADTNIGYQINPKGTGHVQATNGITTASNPTVGQGAAGAVSIIGRKITSISDNVATAILTLTVPNGNHSGCLRVLAAATLGDHSATLAQLAFIAFARQTGSDLAVQLVQMPWSPDPARVSADHATDVATADMTTGSVSGASGATQTVDVQITITKSGGSSDNHYCSVLAELVNNNTSGASIT